MWACMRWIKQTGCIFLPLNQPVKPTRTTIENHTTITSNLESALGLKPLQPSVTQCLSLMFAQTEKTCSYPLLSSNWLIISEMHWMHLLPRSIWYYQLLSNLLFFFSSLCKSCWSAYLSTSWGTSNYWQFNEFNIRYLFFLHIVTSNCISL